MKILLFTRRPQYPFLAAEGAQRSNWELLLAVHRAGRAEVRGVCGRVSGADRELELPPQAEWAALGVGDVSRRGADLVIDMGYALRVTDMAHALGVMRTLTEEVEAFRPDVVITFGDLAPQVVALARRHQLPVVLLFHNAEYLLDPHGVEGDDQIARLRAALDDRVRLVGNSAYVCRRIEERYGVRAPLVGTTVDVSAHHGQWNRNGHITFINPAWEKGASVFVELAEMVPEHRFIVVEGWELEPGYREALLDRLARMPNVRFQPRLPSIAPVLAETALLIVPSVWEEAYGRVVIEAHAHGIPVLASDRGGLRDCVGEGGVMIEDYTRPAAWAEAIRAFFADPARQALLSERARRNGELAAHRLENSAAQLLEICAALVERR